MSWPSAARSLASGSERGTNPRLAPGVQLQKIDIPLAALLAAVLVIVVAISGTAADSAAFWTAIFTGTLTVSTVLLWIATEQLARRAEEQAKDTKAIVAAAKKSADAAMGVEIPRPILMRIRSKNPHADPKNWLGESTLTAIFQNHGRTTGVITETCLSSFVGTELPHEPVYASDMIRRTPYTSLMAPGKSYQFVRQLPLTEDSVRAILSGDEYLWVYGYVKFRDFLNIEWQSGFCRVFELIQDASRHSAGRRARFSYGGHSAYTFTKLAADQDSTYIEPEESLDEESNNNSVVE